jgi:hypothetical protein
LKKLFLIPEFCFLLITGLCFSNCKKNTDNPVDKSNIILYDKPLSVIQQCIQGKWELIYAKGGFTGNSIKYVHDDFWEFSNNKIEIIDSGLVYISAPIYWNYEPVSFINGQKTYTINYRDQGNVPYKFYVEGIKNDTLTIVECALDGMGLHFAKSY